MTSDVPANENPDGPARVNVQVLIYSDSLSPEEISARLNLQPTRTAQKGIRNGKRTGTPTNVPRHIWQLSSESQFSGQDFASHLDWIFSKLLPVRETLRALQDSKAVESFLHGVMWTSGTVAYAEISTRHAELLMDFQLELRLEFADYGEDD